MDIYFKEYTYKDIRIVYSDGVLRHSTWSFWCKEVVGNVPGKQKNIPFSLVQTKYQTINEKLNEITKRTMIYNLYGADYTPFEIIFLK